ncbi:DUF1269 domain-containing protein [Rhodococcus sp. D2-41]|uniref:DUF6325 family protein n=1 Tax=Speluncibacter jeojiensis TaxID=2710754 RepID=UPI00240F06A9|nr:DUF6325 family protein [Rhodococcus sp. D2-41]MDG3009463.1 DUF1269 domain-containing protein [Rhodococcus sp. D2-41]
MTTTTGWNELGPVELVVLTFPGTSIDRATVEEIRDLVAHGQVTLLDLVYLAKDENGNVTQVDVDEDLAGVGLAELALDAKALVSDDDLEVVRESLEPGTSAALIVYEETWARRLALRVRQQGGEVALHIQVPRDVLQEAVEAAL